jgi:hypothetical protein
MQGSSLTLLSILVFIAKIAIPRKQAALLRLCCALMFSAVEWFDILAIAS